MSSINSVRNLQKRSIFSRKNIEIKNLKNREKRWPRTLIYTYYFLPNIVIIKCGMCFL